MRFLRTAVAVLVGAALAIPVTVTAAPQGSATSAGTYTGSWSGSTGQGRTMKFTVSSANKVTSMVVGYKISSGGCVVTGKSTLKSISAPITSTKTFKVTKSIASTSFVVKGTMSSASKSYGTLKVVMTDPTGFGCSGTLRTGWHAHK